MTLSELVPLALESSLALTVFAAGLTTQPRDASYLIRHGSLLWRTVLVMSVLVPFAAVWVALVFRMNPAVKLALVVLALAPVPPVFPSKAMKLSANPAFAISLMLVAALLSLVTIPAWLLTLAPVLGIAVTVPFEPILRILGFGIVLPVALGAAVQRLWPQVARALARPLNVVATVVLALGVMALLARVWPALVALTGDGTILICAALALAAAAIGYACGGPEPDDRIVLAMAASVRHPAVAISMATAMYPAEKAAPAAVLVAFLVGSIALLPLVRRRKGVIARRLVTADAE